MAQEQVLLRVEGISKAFPGVQALSDVRWRRSAGESWPWWARTARASPR